MNDPVQVEPTTRLTKRVCLGCGKEFVPLSGNDSRVCGQCLFGIALEPTCEAPWREEDPPAPPVVTPTLGPFALVEEIGRGGMGIVYRAIHHQTGETVAVKTLLPQDIGCAETMERFRREAKAAQGLVHRHSMPILEVGHSEQGVPFFSMPLALGGSLHQLREKYQGRWRQVAGLLVKVAKAVHHAHERGILHRDLKPGNILFTEEHEPLVIDFGLAKQLTGSSDLTQSYAVLGTPNYVAPEQAAGETRDLTTAADIYSLGTILFELLTGRPPFVGDNPLDVLHQVANQRPQKPRQLVPSIPKILETICMRCLERRPEDRYRSAQELADDLGCWLAGRSISRLPMPVRLWKVIKPRGGTLARFAVFLTVVALSVYWSISFRRPPAVTNAPSIAVAVESWDPDSAVTPFAEQAANGLMQGMKKCGIVPVPLEQGTSSLGLATVCDPVGFGRANHTQFALMGSVRRADAQLRFVICVLRCDTGEVVWRQAENFPTQLAAKMLPVATETLISELSSSGQLNPGTSKPSPHDSPLPEAQTFYTRAMELAARTNQTDLNAAVILFRRAIEIDPRFSAAHAMLGFALWTQADAYGELDKLPMASSAARQALVLNPASAQAHRVLGSCCAKVCHHKEALEEFWTALELNPQSAGCCVSLAICLRDLGHPEQAIPWLRRAVQLEPAHSICAGTLAETLAICGHDEEATTTLTHAIELDDNLPELQLVLGGLKTWRKQFADARTLFQGTCHRFPNNRFGVSMLAWVELCDGKNADAQTYYEKLRADHAYQRTWELYGAINPSSALAYLAKQGGSPETMRALVEEATKIDLALLNGEQRNPRIVHDLAATYAVAGENERSLRTLQDAVSAGWVEYRSTEIDPRFAEIARTPRFKQILRGNGPDSDLHGM